MPPPPPPSPGCPRPGRRPRAAPARPSASPPAATFAALGADARQDLIILGETRPIFVRLRALPSAAGRSAPPGLDAGRDLATRLDRDHDGKLTPAEAEAGGLPLFLAASGPRPPRGEFDARPKDGTIADDELPTPSAGPMRRSASWPTRAPTAGPTPCSTTSTATRTASSPAPSWP